MKKITDSVGNPLPDSIWATEPKFCTALKMNNFLMKCEGYLKEGKKVIYNVDSKQAVISDETGFQMVVSHE